MFGALGTTSDHNFYMDVVQDGADVRLDFFFLFQFSYSIVIMLFFHTLPWGNLNSAG